MPSIQALNAQMGNAQGDAASAEGDAQAQGQEGVANNQSTVQNEPGPQGSFQQPIDNIQ